MKSGPCVKQTVTATLIAKSGKRYVATNHCDNPQTVCPRGDMPTGVGYHLCREICQQKAHAEVNAITLAGADAMGAKIYLEGHTYACEPCKVAAANVGAEIIVASPPMKFNYGTSVAGYDGSKRRDDDFYPTPPDATVALVRRYAEYIPSTVWEPSCGDGAMARVMRRLMPDRRILATDLVHRGYGMGGLNFLRVPALPDRAAIITNPPFNLADNFITHAHELGSPFVALLLKMQFWNARKRVALWHKHTPKAVHPITWRVDWTGQGAATMDLMWCVWGDVPMSNEPLVRPK